MSRDNPGSGRAVGQTVSATTWVVKVLNADGLEIQAAFYGSRTDACKALYDFTKMLDLNMGESIVIFGRYL